ncbi:MAG: FKBP-type peptidyl-prolyl cis-trans isomerase [Muribaculaceae bacterium]|nr:FKBP-type peptidyl-prolyl cis-trans isomerase [Muribaculaceae bacterium]
MKKIVLACGVGAMMLATASCCGDSCTVGSSYKNFDDSVSAYYGCVQGRALAELLVDEPEEFQKRFNKDSFFKGLRQVVLADTSDYAYMSGISIGMNYNREMQQFMDGVNFNRELIVDEIEKAFSADSIANFDDIKYKLDSLFNQVIERATKKHMEQLSNSPEAVQNRQTGRAFIDKRVAEDPEVVVTPSGLAYKKLRDGNGQKPEPVNSVKIAYKGSLIDGTVFDQLLPDNDKKFPISGFVAGFTEGLLLMDKGSSYIFYIPGKLAYGVDGLKQAGIGPDETLIFEVELLDIYE